MTSRDNSEVESIRFRKTAVKQGLVIVNIIILVFKGNESFKYITMACDINDQIKCLVDKTINFGSDKAFDQFRSSKAM